MKQELQRKMREVCEVYTRGTRDYGLDNIRFFLIFCVVFGHLLEIVEKTVTSNWLYEVIYSIHMPAFLFLCGYNIRFSVRRIMLDFCIPYVVFQTLYILYDLYIVGADEILQYTTPNWILWYMLVCIYCQILVPLYGNDGKKAQVATILCTVVIALLIGYDKSIGYHLSLSRFFVFQPFFVLGFYCKKNDILRKLSIHTKMCSVISRIGVYGILLAFIYLRINNLPYGLLYGCQPYDGYGITLERRATIMIISLCWIIFLFVVIKPYLNKKIPLLTTIGQNTLPIYLMHGFVVKAIPEFCPALLSTPWSILLISCLILLTFGNKVCQKGIHYLCFGWREKWLK